MRKLIQPRAAQGAGSVNVYHDWKAVTYHYANETLKQIGL